MGNPFKFEQARAQALEALAQMAAGREIGEPARKARVPEMPAPEFAQEAPGSIHLIKNSLNGGELSPELSCRFDQQRAASGCHELLNMIPLPWGGIRKRPPLEFVCQCEHAGPSARTRLLPFVFSQAQSRLLELGGQAGAAACDLRVFDCEGVLLYSKKNFLPLAPGALSALSFTQSADVIFTAHRDMRPGKIMRFADDDWRYAEIGWLPAVPAPEWHRAFASGSWPEGESRRLSYEYVVTAIDDETGEESPPSGVWTVSWTAPLSESWFVTLQVRAQEGASEYHFYRRRAGVFGFVGLANEPSHDGGQEIYAFEDRNVEPDTADTPPRARDPFAGADERPSLVFLHQQRLGYAASRARPLTVWLSQSGSYESMAASLPPQADDAIEATLAAAEANSIIWAMPDRGGLLLGSQGGVWLLAPGEGAALSPSDLSFQPQCNCGSMEGLAPLRGPSGIIFAQRGGRAVRHLGYSFQDDRYTAADLSILARHIFTGRAISSWAYQQEPWSIVWCCLDDGSLAGLTFLREHEIMAWHRHETAGFIEQACALPLPDGAYRVFFTVLRDGVRCLESFSGGEAADEHSVFLDGQAQSSYKARCIPCLPEGQAEGAGFLMLKKINSIKARVLNSRPFKARICSQDHAPSKAMPVPASTEKTGFVREAVWNCPLGAGFREDARLELIMDGPGPVSITALIINAEFADMAGGQQ